MVAHPKPVPAEILEALQYLNGLDQKHTLSVNKGKLAMFIDALSYAVAQADPKAHSHDGYDVKLAILYLVPKSALVSCYQEACEAIYGWFCDSQILISAIVQWCAWSS